MLQQASSPWLLLHPGPAPHVISSILTRSHPSLPTAAPPTVHSTASVESQPHQSVEQSQLSVPARPPARLQHHRGDVTAPPLPQPASDATLSRQSWHGFDRSRMPADAALSPSAPSTLGQYSSLCLMPNPTQLLPLPLHRRPVVRSPSHSAGESPASPTARMRPWCMEGGNVSDTLQGCRGSTSHSRGAPVAPASALAVCPGAEANATESLLQESEDDEIVRKTTLREVKVLRSLKQDNIVNLKVPPFASTRRLPAAPHAPHVHLPPHSCTRRAARESRRRNPDIWQREA